MSDKRHKHGHLAHISCDCEPVTVARTAEHHMSLADCDHKAEPHAPQIESVKLQRHIIAHGDRILVPLQGRDAAGDNVSFKRGLAHRSPSETAVVAICQPSDRGTRTWRFQRPVQRFGQMLVNTGIGFTANGLATQRLAS